MDLRLLVIRIMPYGKYKDRLIADLTLIKLRV